jgi:hypothetical protein
MNVSQSEYEAWEYLCNWLEDQPYNASYTVPKGYSWLTLTRRDAPLREYGRTAYERAKRVEQIRRSYALIYWATGFGWRLRKDYRAALERMKANIFTSEAQP